MMDSPFTPIVRKVPFWATRHFRLLAFLFLAALGGMGIVLFKLMPYLQSRGTKLAKQPTPGAYIPPDPATSTEPLPVKFDGILDRAKDGDLIVDPNGKENEKDEPYNTLVRYAATSDPAVLSKEVRTVDYSTYVTHTSGLRGETIRLKGLLIKNGGPIKVFSESGGVKWIHRVWITSTTGDECYVVDMIDPVPEGTLEKRPFSLVTVDAVFLRLGSYEGKKDQKKVPYFVARGGMRIIERKVSQDGFGIGAIAVGAAAVGLFLAVFLGMRMFRKPPAARPSRLTLIKSA